MRSRNESKQKIKATSVTRSRFVFAPSGLTTGSGVSGYASRASRGDLRLRHFFCLRSFRSLRHFKLDFLALFEGLEAITLNGAVMNKDIRRAGLLNEAIALRVIEPLDLAGHSRHN